jgi:hypothetical protein
MTTLTPGAPSPFKDDSNLVASPQQEPTPPGQVKTASNMERLKQYKAKVASTEAMDTLRTHLHNKPCQSMTQIRRSLGWSQSKAELVMAAIRSEVGNGYVMKSSLIELKKVKP